VVPIDPDIVKRAVLSNFNASPQLTGSFEDRYGLFRDLAFRLTDECGIEGGMNVWDVGCGTGISSFALAERVGQEGHVVGIDFSPDMLDIAVMRRRGWDNLSFVLQDADMLDMVPGPRPDAVLYNASIFLMPSPEMTLISAHDILPDGGIVGMNYLIGTTDASGDVDICLSAKNEGLECAPYGRSIIDPNDLPEMLENSGFKDVRTGIVEIPMPRDEVRGFYAIPAQSAGLWPKSAYQSRLVLLDSLLDHFEPVSKGRYVQRWGWCTAIK
jgi:ubiquinone/menaquinone biosynthesis C-methylase UbiE